MPDRLGHQATPPPGPDAAFQTPPAVERFVLGPFETNCYVVHTPAGSGHCWIVDASFDPAGMIHHLRSARLTPSLVILTHAHVDHIAGLEEVRRAFPGVPVLIHRAEADFLTDPTLNLSAALGEPVIAHPPDRLLQGGETLVIDGTPWKVLHTPGHSPGGITLWCESARLALVGDTLFSGSIGRFDFPTSNEQTLIRSIREVLYALPDDTRILPGHGPETTIGVEKRTNPFVRA